MYGGAHRSDENAAKAAGMVCVCVVSIHRCTMSLFCMPVLSVLLFCNGHFHEGADITSGHDLVGLMSYYNTASPLLHFPMMALIDYRGYRLIAQSLLPINKSTLRV